MSLTVREQIYEKLAEVLAEGLEPFFEEIRVERNRDAAVQRFPSVNVLDGPQTRDQPESVGFTGYTATATVEGFVQQETPAELGPALNELYGRVIQVLMADRKLGGLAIDMSEGSMEVEIGRRENQRPVAGFAVDIEVKFWTSEDDPFELGPGD